MGMDIHSHQQQNETGWTPTHDINTRYGFTIAKTKKGCIDIEYQSKALVDCCPTATSACIRTGMDT